MERPRSSQTTPPLPPSPTHSNYASCSWTQGRTSRQVVEYLGHSDPGFTLRVYTHLMPNSRDRARKAIDVAFGADSEANGAYGAAPIAA